MNNVFVFANCAGAILTLYKTQESAFASFERAGYNVRQGGDNWSVVTLLDRTQIGTFYECPVQ